MKFKIKNKDTVIFLSFFGIGFLLYINTLNVPFIFDSKALLNDFEIRNIQEAFKNIFLQISSSRRFVYFTFAINYFFGGYNVIGYHIVNILIHILTAFLVYKFISKLLKKNKIAFLTSLIFLINPIQTQSLNLVVQRMVLLSGLFYFMTLYLYMKYKEEKEIKYYILSLIAYLFGIRCKEIVITLPLVLTFIDYKNIKRILPFYFIGALPIVFKIMNSFSHNEGEVLSSFTLIQEKIEMTRMKYFISEFKVILRYILIIILPFSLRIDYNIKLNHSFLEYDVILPFIGIILLISLIIYLYKKKFEYSFALFLFFMGLFVTSTIIPIKDMMFEHRIYISSVGIILFLVLLIDKIKIKNVKKIILIILILFYGTLTYMRNELWKNEINLWQDNIKKEPMKARPRYNLIRELMESGQYKIALKENMELKKIDDYYELYKNMAKIEMNLGEYKIALGNINIAISKFKKDTENYEVKIDILNKLKLINEIEKTALEGIKYNKKSMKLYNYLAEINIIKKDYVKAYKFAQKSVDIKENYRGYFALGYLHTIEKKYKKAINDYKKCIEIGGEDKRVKKNLEQLYKKVGNK